MTKVQLIFKELGIFVSPGNLLYVLPLLTINGFTENNIITGSFVIILFGYSILTSALYEKFDFKLHNPIIWLLLLAYGLFTVSISPNQMAGLKYYAILIFIPFLLFQVICNVKPTEAFFKNFINVQLFSGFVLGMGSLFYALVIGFQERIRLTSFWEGFNMLAGYLMVLFMFNLSFLINRKNNKLLFYHLITLFGIVAGLFLTQTRGVWFATVIAIILFFIKRPKVIVPFSLIVSFLFFMFAAAIKDRFFSVLNFTKDASAVGRIQAWASSMILIRQNPIFGYGFESYVELRDSVFNTYIVKVIHSHNTFLNSLVEMGLIGTVLYFFFFFTAFYYAFKFKDIQFKEKYKEYIDGFQLSFFGLIIIFNFEPYFSVYDNSSLVMWILISLVFLMRKLYDSSLAKGGILSEK